MHPYLHLNVNWDNLHVRFWMSVIKIHWFPDPKLPLEWCMCVLAN